MPKPKGYCKNKAGKAVRENATLRETVKES